MAELHSTSGTSAPLTLVSPPPWALALLAAAVYPALIALFPLAIARLSLTEQVFARGFWAAAAILLMTLAIGVSLLALWALLRTPPQPTPKAIATRRVLHLVFAVPPLYTFTRLVVASRLGLSDWHTLCWLVAAAGAAVLIARARDDRLLPGSSGGLLLRRVHGATAALLLVGFLLLHVLNHAVALWSIELQTSWMTTLRLWYRATLVEPVLLGAFILMILTGIPLMLRNTRTGGNAWRALQSAAGIYIVLFLFSHVSAVLLGRADGRETDWFFATGQNGLIAGSASLIPYYILSIAVLMLHLALGVRMSLLRRGVDEIRVTSTFTALLWIAGISTLWVSAAILGVQLGN